MIDIGVAVAAALLAPASEAWPKADVALANAARFCETVVTRRKADLPAPAGATVHSDPSDGRIPELVKRFGATQTMSRMFGVSSYSHFHASNGQVWVVIAREPAGCDVMVTGVRGGAVALGASFAGSLRTQGWQPLGSVRSSATQPLWQHLLGKRVPKADQPRFAIRLKIQGLAHFAGDEDGIQMELSFLGANLK